MKIKRITVELELEKQDIQSHATLIEFEGGMWSANSPMYSRMGPALHAVWQILRQVAKGD